MTTRTEHSRRRRITGLYAIADLAGEEASAADEAMILALLGERPEGAGPRALQVRAKAAGTAARIACLQRIAGPVARAGVLLIVNDDVDAAIDGPPEVAGVHLGQADLGELADTSVRADRIRSIRERARAAGRRDFLIGVSTHSLAQVLAAGSLAIDYLGFGPIFATASKVDHDPVVGLDGLAEAARRARLPLVAIGGLDPARAALAIQSGATAAAMISALRRSTPAATRSHVADVARALEALAEPAHDPVVP